jgi:spermidine synthase
MIAIAILGMGFSGLVAQMVLLRELLIIFSGNELSIGIILANWLILEASGCFFFRKSKKSIEAFAGITILFSLSLPLAVYLTRTLKVILGISIGESIGFLSMLYSSFFILLLPSLSHGALFPLSCAIYAEDAGSVGKVYVYESVGSIFGGIFWNTFLVTHLNSFQTAAVLCLLNLLMCLVLLTLKAGMLQKVIAGASVLLAIFCCHLFFGKADRLHQLSIRAQWKEHNIVCYQNSVYGNICVVENRGQYIFFLDGIPQIMTPIPDIGFVEEFVHLPLLSHPNPKKLLILSGGAGGVINEILHHPSVELIEYVELDPLLLELIRRFPTPLTETELSDRRVKVRHTDGRLFLKITKNRYDLILIGLKEPSDLLTNRFFTAEFFSIAKKRLAEGGILVTCLPGSFSYITCELKNLNACIFNTLKSVFSYVRVFPGDGRNLFLSSDSEEILSFGRMQILERLKERGIKTDVPIARHIEKRLHLKWQDWFSGFLKNSTQKINRDFAPIGLFYTISYWNTLFAPYLCAPFALAEKLSLWVFFVLFLLFVAFVFLLRSKKILSNLSIPLCIATTGFAGMVFDLAVIFAFQSIYGYIFFWIGLLVTSFMAGAALGAMVITQVLLRIRDCLRFFINTEAAIICFSLSLSFIFLMQTYLGDHDLPFLKTFFLLISFVSGLLTGAQFPLATKIYLKGTSLSNTAGTLYASDLIGGWLGGVVGGVVLFPVLGLFQTLAVIALLKLSSLIAIRACKT